MSSTYPRRLLLCVAALGLIAAACASAKGFELTRVQRKDVQVLPGSEGFVHPLTGIVSYTPQDWQNRRILAIKVGNSAHERPQAGLDSADVVYEEIVEGGVTRFLALFSTNQTPRVGPVRSVRTVDPKILQPFGALFGYSGGVPPVVSELRGTSGVTDVGANVVGEAYRRDSNRQMPYNLYTSTDRLWAGRDGTPPDQQFEFLSSSDDASAGSSETASDIKFSFGGDSAQIRYAYDETSGLYERFNGAAPHEVEGVGDASAQLAFRNVLIQEVSVSTGAIVDRAGLATKDISVIGQGSATLFRGGRVFRGSWSRSGGERTRFIDSSGQPLRLAPGETIVELLPRGRDVAID